jgi:hypothetical protein
MSGCAPWHFVALSSFSLERAFGNHWCTRQTPVLLIEDDQTYQGRKISVRVAVPLFAPQD